MSNSSSICDSKYYYPAMAAYIMIIAVTFIGNSLFIYIIYRNSSLHTFTNYLLAHKSLLDVIFSFFLSIGTPYYFSSSKHTGYSVNVLAAGGFSHYTVVYSCCFTILALSVDKFLAIIFPLVTARRFRSLRVTLPVIWISSVSIGLYSAIFYIQDANNLVSERVKETKDVIYKCFMFIPAFLTGSCYVAIMIKLWKRKIPGNNTVQQQNASRRTTVKVITVLIIMSVSFDASWLPYMMLVDDSKNMCLGMVSHFMLRADGMIMPWVYLFVIQQYSNEFKSILKKFRSKKRQSDCVQREHHSQVGFKSVDKERNVSNSLVKEQSEGLTTKATSVWIVKPVEEQRSLEHSDSSEKVEKLRSKQFPVNNEDIFEEERHRRSRSPMTSRRCMKDVQISNSDKTKAGLKSLDVNSLKSKNISEISMSQIYVEVQQSAIANHSFTQGYKFRVSVHHTGHFIKESELKNELFEDTKL